MLDREALNQAETACEFCKKMNQRECGNCFVENAKYALKKLIEEDKKNG